jgi:hypothetical protein
MGLVLEPAATTGSPGSDSGDNDGNENGNGDSDDDGSGPRGGHRRLAPSAITELPPINTGSQ